MTNFSDYILSDYIVALIFNEFVHIFSIHLIASNLIRSCDQILVMQFSLHVLKISKKSKNIQQISIVSFIFFSLLLPFISFSTLLFFFFFSVYVYPESR